MRGLFERCGIAPKEDEAQRPLTVMVIPDSPQALGLHARDVSAGFRVVFDRERRLFPSEMYALAPVLMSRSASRSVEAARRIALADPDAATRLLQEGKL